MTPLRVLDLTDELGLAAARCFVGMGAEVIRIEVTDPDTVAERTSDPEIPDRQRLHWHAGKFVLRVPESEVSEAIARLVPNADVVLESGPRRQLRTTALRSQEPVAWRRVAHVIVTPFGLSGERADWIANDLVTSAAGGMTWLGGHPEGPPIAPPAAQASQLAGTHAAIAALLALMARERTGHGQLVDISAQEAVAATLETGAIAVIHGGRVPGRTGGIYEHVAHRVFECAQGHVAGGYSGPNRMWDDLLAWMDETGEAGDLTDPIWSDPVHRWENRAHVDKIVTAFTGRRTGAEIATEARRRALPWAEVAAPSDLLENPQLRDRDFPARIETSAGPVLGVGFGHQSPGRPRPITLSEPSEHLTLDWTPRPSRKDQRLPGGQPTRADGTGIQALSGIRVLDLTWVLAGPYVTRTLGDHGAEIIKVESRHRQDPTRFAPSMRLRPGAGPDDSGYFLNFNRNKRSIALNLRTPQGAELLRDLAAEADVVIENFSPGTMAKWGLDWPSLHQLNPRAILVSMSGVGATGPWRNAVTFADTLAAMSGLTHATQDETHPPSGLTFGLGDMVAANTATMAVLELLLRGEPGFVDLSQLEAMAAHLGTAHLDTAQPESRRDESGRERAGVLRTRGADRWLAVGDLTQAQRVLRLSSQTQLGELATNTDAGELAERLQAQGVAAYPVCDGRDLLSDPQLAGRGFFATQTHALAGDYLVDGIVARLAETPGALRSPAPLMGEHTEEILRDVLGLNPNRIAELQHLGVLQ